jgi:hypothetical protein
MTRELAGVWTAIREDPAANGLIRRRVDPESPYDLFLIEARPTHVRSFRAEFPEPPGILWRTLESMKGIVINVNAATTFATIDIVETDVRYHDVFNALIVDVLDGLKRFAAREDPEKGLALDFVAGRIIRWRNCFRLEPEGLGEDKQLGLFGELYILESLISAGVSAVDAVVSWTGPHKSPQDFQIGGSSIEVKTSRQALPVNIQIASERQLDHASDGPMFLIHLAIEVRSDGSGETLPNRVSALRELVAFQSDAGMLLDDSMIAYGYLDIHSARYTNAYNIRYMDCFEVSDTFPRIRERDLPEGVGDVSYLLSLSACEPYRVEWDAAVGSITGANR